MVTIGRDAVRTSRFRSLDVTFPASVITGLSTTLSMPGMVLEKGPDARYRIQVRVLDVHLDPFVWHFLTQLRNLFVMTPFMPSESLP